MGHKCSEFSPPALNLGPHMAPLGMKFYTGDQFPADYKNNIIVAEHGSWNRLKYLGGRLMRVTVDPDGKNAKEVEFASGWISADGKYRGRPNDVLVARTARFWWPMTITAPSTGSATASDPSGDRSLPAAGAIVPESPAGPGRSRPARTRYFADPLFYGVMAHARLLLSLFGRDRLVGRLRARSRGRIAGGKALAEGCADVMAPMAFRRQR